MRRSAFRPGGVCLFGPTVITFGSVRQLRLPLMAFLSGFSAFLDLGYWFNLYPVPLGPDLVSGFLVFFCWFLAVAAVLFVLARHFRKSDGLKRDIFRQFAWLLLNVGLIGLLLLFFAYEQAPVLSMRLWFAVLMVYLAVRLGILTARAVREYPQRKAQVAERRRLNRYFSRTKRH